MNHQQPVDITWGSTQLRLNARQDNRWDGDINGWTLSLIKGRDMDGTDRCVVTARAHPYEVLLTATGPTPDQAAQFLRGRFQQYIVAFERALLPVQP